MGYFYGGYRRRRYSYHRWGGTRSSSRSHSTSRLYAGIDDDVRRMFFALDSFTLQLVFNKYESEYGLGKRKYAESTYQKWKRGSVHMGGEISERLVKIVPNFLSFEQKYELIQKLWDRFRQKTTLSVTISPYDGIAAAVATVMDVIDRIDDHELPSAVADRLDWLSSDDSVAAQALLNQVARREAEVAAQTVEAELRLLIALAVQHSDKIVTGTRTVTLPGATVQIHLSQTANLNRGTSNMTNHNNQPESQPQGQLASPDSASSSRNLAPIQNPNDLLGEALRRMSPEQQEQVIGKATGEALRLQVKAKEGQIDHQMASSKVESAAEAAQRLGQTGNEFEVRAEHRSEHGSVHVTVKKRASLSERVGGCFVATACFGDFDHPTVIILRDFRDGVLVESAFGRRFVVWYYKNGPSLAKVIEGSVITRGTCRVLLAPIVLLARLCLKLKPPNYL